MIDTALITIKSGDGGDGIVSFRREKYIPKGGPWGGDGANGGNLIFLVDDHINTLSAFRRQRVFKAQDGQDGMKNLRTGKQGEDLIIRVPKGTLIKNQDNEVLRDLTNDNEEYIISKGGRGGLGNWHFKSSVNKTPRKATPGVKTPIMKINLELKLLADAGFIGMPNSGKSTLLNILTNSKAKTASYEFTTLEPNLGVLESQDIVLADIPGLIEGASSGKGLGHDFLRHVERTKLLIHILDGSFILNNPIDSIYENYKTIRNELGEWNTELLKKSEIVVINKCDIPEVLQKEKEIRKTFTSKGVKNILFISAATGYQLDKLIYSIAEEVEKNKNNEVEFVEKKDMVLNIKDLKNKRIVFLEKQSAE